MEKRKLKRWHLIYYLRLFDHDNEAQVGHVVDIHTGGIKVVSQWPLPVEKFFNLWMEVPRPSGGGIRRIHFKAQSLWSRPDDGDDRFHNTGFRLVDPSTETTNAISRLVKELELRE